MRGRSVSDAFFNHPILNSPYELPQLHHHLDAEGQPTDLPPIAGRRRSELITPLPKPKKTGKTSGQWDLTLTAKKGLSDGEIEYNPTPIINEIRQYVDAWRALPNPAQWQVKPPTQRLLQHWRSDQFANQRPFFCQVEAVETMIWLTEVAAWAWGAGPQIPKPRRGRE